MKHVLIIKTSSLGDVIHTLPALTDAANNDPEIQFDWVVEESFAEIASWHPAVNDVIPVKIRAWRKSPLKTLRSDEWKLFRQKLKSVNYDTVIDAQGLLKSALLLPLTNGPRYGLDKHSAREGLASLLYNYKFNIDKDNHAVERTRMLFARSLGYSIPDSLGDYGIKSQFIQSDREPYIVLLHGTTWDSKHYPEHYWRDLITRASSESFKIKLLWGNDSERNRAEKLAKQSPKCEVMPKLSLSEIASLLSSAHGAIAVDTGLGHLAASVDCPTVSLYMSTNPGWSGAYGMTQKHMAVYYPCAPCMKRVCPLPASEDNIHPPCATTIPPDVVWNSFRELTQSL